MKLSIIIPCYNEKDTIEEVISRVKEIDYKNLEVILVDDCSSDGTRELIETELTNRVDRIILHEVNKGKGAALRSGFAEVTGDIVIVQDADLEYDPQEIPKLIQPIIAGVADVVYGSRFIGGGPHRVLYFWHRLGNGFLTFLSNMFTNLNLTDMETCYKAFKRELIQSIKIEVDRFGFEPEVTAKIARKGARIYEMGISYHGRTYQQGKKIGWRDGFRAIYCIVKYGLFH